MKRVVVLCACIVITAGVLAGCSGGLSADVSTVQVDKKGKVTGLTVESFEKDYYSKEDLESFITEQVEDYTSQNPDSTVEVKDISVEEQVAKVMVEYADSEEYASFNEREFYAGTVVQARAAGYGFDADFYQAGSTAAEEGAQAADGEADAETEGESSDAAAGNTEGTLTGSVSGSTSGHDDAEGGASGHAAAAENTVDVSSILNEDGYKTVVTDERINVKVPGEILYVSDPAAVLVSEDTIELPADESRAEGMQKTLVYIIYK